MGKFIRLIDETIDNVASYGGYAADNVARFIRFSMSSSSTMLLDLLVLIILVEFFGVFYLVAAGIAFTTSNSVNYVINRFWGFRDTKQKLAKGYLLFIFIGTLGLGLTVFLMWVFVSLLGVFYFLSRIIVAIIEGTISFVLHYFITFKIHRDKVSRTALPFSSRI